ncbi:hypothetical protein [Stenotrophomonas phage IME-SM1]|uniref:Uncharacterized protein n=1 Tax=Stenotrophomonas phage IME-SM1 TaxID=1654717 RepID=A0A0H4IPB7_9CAUD|nr:hypothetical protein KMC40_gp163 [Stenotrophomonas phage IME-SM1]AKO61595.1 hypothetical protein [Stenotrophomonas phage IME-SM1]
MDNLTLITPQLAQQIQESYNNREVYNALLVDRVCNLIEWFIVEYDLGDVNDDKLRRKVRDSVMWRTGTWAFTKSLSSCYYSMHLDNAGLHHILDVYNATKPADCYLDLSWNYRQLDPKRKYDDRDGYDFTPGDQWYLTGFWWKRLKTRLWRS